ncbi:hypothetical protein FXO38_14465 [Capsicum annuum]|nr:hypothetical protein FXO38_14465 [Capsicum annuum]
MFLIAPVVGKPLQLDIATINKTSSSYARVKVLVDLLAKLPKMIEIEVVNTKLNESKVQGEKIQYDFLLKYCKICKLQRHEENECRPPHSELKKAYHKQEEEDTTDQNAANETNATVIRVKRSQRRAPMWQPTNRRLKREVSR